MCGYSAFYMLATVLIYEVWTIVTPTLKIRKLRHREANQPAQVSSAQKW